MAYEPRLRLPLQAAPIDRTLTFAALSTDAGVKASQGLSAILPPVNPMIDWIQKHSFLPRMTL